MKPLHQGGYNAGHTELCERALVTLLRGLGPWKKGIYLIGGLVPAYLVGNYAGADDEVDASTLPAPPPPHVGTSDVDIVLDFEILAKVEAYYELEENLKRLRFERGRNEKGNQQHHRWYRSVGEGRTIVLDLLCDSGAGDDSRVITPLPSAGGLSAIRTRGAYLVFEDHFEVTLKKNLLDDDGIARETVRVAGVVPFVVLKALAYEDRHEKKDAYDLVYVLTHYRNGPADVAAAFAESMRRLPDEGLFAEALGILRNRFASDEEDEGYRKDGPVSYAPFVTDPALPDADVRNQRHAAGVVEELLSRIDS